MKREWNTSGAALAAEIAGARPPAGTAALWYLGQCGVVCKAGETAVAVDVVLNDLTDTAGHTRRRYPPPFAPEALKVDYFFCTHGHADHMALPTLAALAAADEGVRFVLPGGCAGALEGAVPADRVIPMAAGQTLALAGVTVRAFSAAHPTHQTDAAGRDLALGYSLTMDGVHLLHLGDTYLTDRLLAALRALPRPDVFFPPVNGGDYFRTARGCIGNLNPLEAARLAALLDAGLTMPTHWDMVEGNTADPLDFVRALWREAPAARLWLPALGEMRWVTGRP